MIYKIKTIDIKPGSERTTSYIKEEDILSFGSMTIGYDKKVQKTITLSSGDSDNKHYLISIQSV